MRCGIYRARWTTRRPRDRKAVDDVTTHLRARAVQAGAVLALVGGVVAVASSPALADAPTVQISVGSRDVPSGGTVALSYTVTNNNDTPGILAVNVAGNGFNCTDGCSPQAPVNGNQTTQPFQAKLTAPQVADGQTRTVQVVVVARVGNDTGQDVVQFAVHGADKPQTVRQVSGRVKDQNGKSVAGANVGMRDSQNHIFTATSNDEGRFAFTSSDQKPIVPGTLTVGATKDGFKEATVNVQGTAGRTVNVPLTLQLVEASASPSPSATETTAAPTDDATQDPTANASAPPLTNPQNAAQDSNSGSLLYIILGALLVAAGVGAIVLLIMRRRGKKDEDDLDGFGGGGPVPPSQGGYNGYNGLPDATRVAAPVGGGNDATMVAAHQPSMSDAPTMMQPAIPGDDEYADPYGAPAVPGGGYA